MLKYMELRKFRLPVPLQWQQIMLNKPDEDLPALSEGDVNDIIRTFGDKRREKRSKSPKRAKQSSAQQSSLLMGGTQAETHIQSEVPEIPKLKSVENPNTKKIETRKLDGSSTQDGLLYPRKQSNSDNLPDLTNELDTRVTTKTQLNDTPSTTQSPKLAMKPLINLGSTNQI